MSDDSGFWTGVIVTLGLVGLVYSCNQKKTDPPAVLMPVISPSATPAQDALDPGPTFQPPVIPIPPKPTHRYDSVEGSIYYYGAKVTEEQEKTGKRAPDMLGFHYLGKDAQGRDRVEMIGGSASSCARPCEVIHYDNGSAVGFDEGSVIGAVYADIADGMLKKWSPPKPKEPAPWQSDPIVTNGVDPE